MDGALRGDGEGFMREWSLNRNYGSGLVPSDLDPDQGRGLPEGIPRNESSNSTGNA